MKASQGRGTTTATATARGLGLSFIALFLAASCGEVPELQPLPQGTIAFGVFGDGPYMGLEERRFGRLLTDVDSADVEWLLHIGDVLWFPCTAEAYTQRRDALNTLDLPVVYTPGDNEWADCHEERPGGHEPLASLASLRSVFFADPHRSIGGRPMPIETQADDSVHAEFVENARWRRGRIIFATIHAIGSANGRAPFDGRTEAHDAEVSRRVAATLEWLDETFAIARDDSLATVVIGFHGNPFGEDVPGPRPGFEEIVARLEQLAAAFPGEILLIHGDSHTQRVDHPLTRGVGGPHFDNVTRLETFGSPDIGWIRVVIDTVSGAILDYQPRLMPGRIPFH